MQVCCHVRRSTTNDFSIPMSIRPAMLMFSCIVYSDIKRYNKMSRLPAIPMVMVLCNNAVHDTSIFYMVHILILEFILISFIIIMIVFLDVSKSGTRAYRQHQNRDVLSTFHSVSAKTAS